MNLPDLTKLVILILAVSVASERLITFLKILIPRLSVPPTKVPAEDSWQEIARKVAVIILAFLSCWLSADLVDVPTLVTI